MDSQLHAGPAGLDPAPCPQVGVTPPPVFLGPNGTQQTIADQLRTLLVSSPAFVDPFDGNNEIGTTFEGQPGEAVLLFLSAQPAGTGLLSSPSVVVIGDP